MICLNCIGYILFCDTVYGADTQLNIMKMLAIFYKSEKIRIFRLQVKGKFVYFFLTYNYLRQAK